MYKVLLQPKAKEELQQAISYYAELEVTSLAEKFIQSFEDTLNALEMNPHFQIKHPPYRACKMKKFPYILFFRIIEELELITVESIFHTSQDPDKYPQ
ncbi:MAG: type II toxin-antitoxin system RelE/ParE family toxin [Chitinophagales bacterium]|nr:type II toxin-antitoxin system RelE/ParE family toxin [Sphingobacteriales bacterium]